MVLLSGVATGGASGGQSATPDSKKFAKNREKEGKVREKEEKSGRKGKNREGSLTLPLLTDRAGYATGLPHCALVSYENHIMVPSEFGESTTTLIWAQADACWCRFGPLCEIILVPGDQFRPSSFTKSTTCCNKQTVITLVKISII